MKKLKKVYRTDSRSVEQFYDCTCATCNCYCSGNYWQTQQNSTLMNQYNSRQRYVS